MIVSWPLDMQFIAVANLLAGQARFRAVVHGTTAAESNTHIEADSFVANERGILLKGRCLSYFSLECHSFP